MQNCVFQKALYWRGYAMQIMIGIGASIGISYYVPVRTPEVTAYIATGVPTITLLTIGMTLLPQSIA